MAPQRSDDLLELVGDVELGGVEEQEDQVAAGGEPGADLDKVEGAGDALLLPREDPGRVDERHVLEDPAGGVAPRALEARQERVAKGGEAAPGERGVDGQGRARGPAVLQGVGDGDDAVGRGFRADVGARVFPIFFCFFFLEEV